MKTRIEGLTIRFNKVVFDKRGYLCEISKQTKYRALAVIFSKKGVGRGGHYHLENYDLACVPYGTALWYFYDIRKKSPTKGNEEYILAGEDSLIPQNTIIRDFTIKKTKKIALITIPPGVYHLVYAVSHQKPILLEFASHAYDESDYVRIAPEKMPNYQNILKILKLFKIKPKSSQLPS